MMRSGRFLPDEGPEDICEEKGDELHLRVGNKLLEKILVDSGCSLSSLFS